MLAAALLSIPAFAQTADLSVEWGSPEFLINQFGDETGDLTGFCLSISEDPSGFLAQFPELAPLCGFSVEEPVETSEESAVE